MPVNEKVILVIGSCGMDRLLTVSSYPEPDAKVRTTDYNEVGGGNAANTATALARLSQSTLFRDWADVKIKLCTKLGDDSVGQQIVRDLESEGIDLTSPLFQLSPSGTTSFTTILVSEEEHTRTCIHTPGTCGELTLDDLDKVDLDEVFRNVVLFHTDARHTDVALALAREAQSRGIPVSLDVEKDRNTRALDALMEVASIILTNAYQLEDYLAKLTKELELSKGRHSLSTVEISSDPEIDPRDANLLAHLIRPSIFFTRWYNQIGKEVVVTRGSQGSAWIRCESIRIQEEASTVDSSKNQVHISIHDNTMSSATVEHTFSDRNDEGEDVMFVVRYSIQTRGVLSDVQIVDTTGAGDAFIGAFILSTIHPFRGTNLQSALAFSSWVGGKKLGGPGARTAIPKAVEVDQELGSDAQNVQKALDRKVGCFHYESKSFASLEAEMK